MNVEFSRALMAPRFLMMVMMMGLVLGLGGVGLPAAWAGTLTFPEDGFAVTLPEGWVQETIPAGASSGGNKVVLMAHNTDKTRLAILTVQAVPVKDAAGIAQFLADAMGSHQQRGWRTSEVRDLKVKGVPFAYFSVGQKGAAESMLFTACTFTPNQVFGMMGIAKGGDADADKALQGILESFEFLKPMAAVVRKP